MYYAVSQARVNAAPASMLRPPRPGDVPVGASLYELVGYRQPPSSSSSSSPTGAALLPKAAREKPEAPADTPGTGPGTGAHAGGGPRADAKEEQQKLLQRAAQQQFSRFYCDYLAFIEHFKKYFLEVSLILIEHLICSRFYTI